MLPDPRSGLEVDAFGFDQNLDIDHYVLGPAGTGKWGPSQSLGTPGGVVTWSLIPNGTAIDSSIGSGAVTALSNFLYSGFETQLKAAFDQWSSVANINFIQVTDGGGAVGLGTMADIRLSGIPVDGALGTLAFTFYSGQGPVSGEIVLDTDDASFYNTHSLLVVAAHEIGHAIGLAHSPDTNALMYAIYNSSLNGVQPDDIAGAQAIYGAAQPAAAKVYTLPSGQNTLTVLDGIAGLTINGNSAANTITGSSQNETIKGLGGDDTLNGGGGDDTFVATLSDGNDSYTGGNGWDILDCSAVGGVVQINQLAGTTTGSAGNDTLGDVFEQIIGSNFGDVLSGGHGINCIDGMGGNDLIFGNNGDDLLRGGDGDDTFFFSANDGDDRMLGGNGWDILDYSTLAGAIQVNQLAGTTTGTANNDTLIDTFEQVIGTAFGDVLSGGHGINSLNGGGGNDQIFANGGDDWVRGGTGNDTITLGSGNDVFAFWDGDGTDTITDFVAGAGTDDVINLHFESAAVSFAHMQSAAMISQVGADTVINFGGDSIILLGVTSTNLHQDDFVFV